MFTTANMQQQDHIPVVQGYAVDNREAYSKNNATWSHQEPGYKAQAAHGYVEPDSTQRYEGLNSSDTQGESQPKQAQDVIWAVLFVIHLLVMAVIMITMGNQYSVNVTDYSGVVWVVSTCGLTSVGLSSLALGLMMKFATELVKIALFFSVGCSLAMGIFSVMTGQMWAGIVGFLCFAIGCCYIYAVWGRIPVSRFNFLCPFSHCILKVDSLVSARQFAVANLRTALVSVRENMGMVAIAYVFLALAFLWTIWWSVTAGATISYVGQVSLFFFLLSYYWVHQVFQNTVHVTTAGNCLFTN